MEKDLSYLDALTGSTLFADISRSDAAAMMRCLGGSAAHYKSGETILREGEPADRLGLVLAGRAQVARADYDGNRSVLTDVRPGELFAEAFAFADVARMPVDVTAVEDTDVLLLDAGRIVRTCANACEFHNRLIMNLLRVAASKNLVMNRKLEITSRRTTREKLLTYLEMQARAYGSAPFTIPFARQELADYLEVDRSGLSAEIGKLRREGVLESEKSRFTLLRRQTEPKRHEGSRR